MPDYFLQLFYGILGNPLDRLSPVDRLAVNPGQVQLSLGNSSDHFKQVLALAFRAPALSTRLACGGETGILVKHLVQLAQVIETQLRLGNFLQLPAKLIVAMQISQQT